LIITTSAAYEWLITAGKEFDLAIMKASSPLVRCFFWW
jgi:hypothetical protein